MHQRPHFLPMVCTEMFSNFFWCHVIFLFRAVMGQFIFATAPALTPLHTRFAENLGAVRAENFYKNLNQ